MTLPMVLLTYLGILAIPGVANPFHSVQWTTHLDPQVFIAWAALIVLGLLAIAFASRSPRRRVYLFCAIWGLVTIAPALKIDTVWWLNQDRYAYAPSFGWSLALALAVFEISTVGARARLAVGIATALLLLSYGIATIRGQRYWYDNLAYYTRAVQVKPNDPYYRLAVGNLLEEAKDPAGAAKQTRNRRVSQTTGSVPSRETRPGLYEARPDQGLSARVQRVRRFGGVHVQERACGPGRKTGRTISG